MLNYSIMPLDNTEHVDEICEDIREQYEQGVASCALFKMTLVPEGIPPTDKIGALIKKYDVFHKKLKSMGLPCGILVQATIGHGYKLNAPIPFRQYVGLTNGEKMTVCCPDDDDFCNHMREVFRTIALHNPDIVMVDDDFRMIFRDGGGCVCSAHMEEFNRRAGTSFSREDLWDALLKDDDTAHKYTDIFVGTQGDSLLKAARAMREGIDSVDPTLPGAFCSCGANMESAAEIASILAGKGNPVIVRINNGHYLCGSGRNFSLVYLRAATQIDKLRGFADHILDEPDTCPQNRYSTSAQALHAHYAGSILEGTTGAKHWITRLTAYEPSSGKAYRKILSKYKKFYEALAELSPWLEWKGCRIPLSKKPYFDLVNKEWYDTEREGWSCNVLERLGLPLYYSSKSGGAVFMEGKAARKFSDEQIREFFKGTIVLAADTAEELIKRGFSDLIGVDIREWKGLPMSSELLDVNGKHCNVQTNAKELVPLSDKVRADSTVCHSVDRVNFTPLFPGTTVFDNPLGGTTVVFCGTPVTPFNISQPFSMLNESRKKQFIRILSNAGVLSIYYPDDGEVFLKTAELPDGTDFCFVLDLGIDTLDEIPLTVKKKYSSVHYLDASGQKVPLAFRYDGDTIVIEKSASILEPIMLFLA